MSFISLAEAAKSLISFSIDCILLLTDEISVFREAIEDKSFVVFSLNSFKILTVACNASIVLFISACVVVAFVEASNALRLAVFASSLAVFA